MQGSTAQPRVDEALLKRFRSEIKSKVPFVVEKDGKKLIVNPTPLEDLTVPLVECARVEYGLEIATANNVRGQLSDLGLDTARFDKSRAEIEGLLARQDVINLAKLLAKVYGGFCPEQYDNELNVKSHEAVTAPEIDQQLKDNGLSLAEFKIISAFGTGGTSAGISRYLQTKYGKKSVHVVFPLKNQDVAGIRTKDKALGLRFYDPALYAGQHEVNFEQARRVLRFFVGMGFYIREMSALALFACLQMLNYGVGDKLVVMLADGIDKYRSTLGTVAQSPPLLEVTLPQASTSVADYGEVLWTHGMFVPKEDGIKLLASSLGCDEGKIKVDRASHVQALISSEKIPDNITKVLPKDNRKVLLVCMAGCTSLRVAQIFATNGVPGQRLTGGIMSLSESSKKEPSDLVQIARE